MTKCVLEVLIKNKLIKIEKTEKNLGKTTRLCLPLFVIKLDISKPKFNKRLRELLEEEYITYFLREYGKEKHYRCIKKDDIRKFIKDLPKQELLVLNLSGCSIDLRIAFEKTIKEEFENLSYEYDGICKNFMIKNLEIQKQRREKEEDEDEEALRLLEKIW